MLCSKCNKKLVWDCACLRFQLRYHKEKYQIAERLCRQPSPYMLIFKGNCTHTDTQKPTP